MADVHGIVMIVPVARWDDANRVMCALGLDGPPRGVTMAAYLPGRFFSVELSTNGTSITHYGARMWAKRGAIAQAVAAVNDNGVTWSDYGLTRLRALAAWAAIDRDGAQTNEPQSHFFEALAASGYRRVFRNRAGAISSYEAQIASEPSRLARIQAARAAYVADNP